ncbi:MAG: PLP-dependent transferase [Opitutales bacterium]
MPTPSLPVICGLRAVSLGERVPDSEHALCVSLPALADVVGYEEKDPLVMNRVVSGYPRFISHHWVVRLADCLAAEQALADRVLYLCQSARGARALAAFVGERADPLRGESPADGLAWVALPTAPRGEVHKRAFAFLQHTGVGISSRQAEDCLVRRGILPAVGGEDLQAADPEGRVRKVLADAYGLKRPDGVVLCNSGMNAFYAGFRALQQVQREAGRDCWIQLGWLYLDTGKILEQFRGASESLERVFRVDDLDAVEAFLEREGDRVAGIITEAPTNPLLACPDLPRLRELADAAGTCVIVDPTMATPLNVDVLPYADLVVNSLTKYTAAQGDVMAGALVANPQKPHFLDLLAGAMPFVEPPYARDLQRLAAQIDRFPEVVSRANANCRALARFLEQHPAVDHVWWLESAENRPAFDRIRRPRGGPGAVLSFSLVDGLSLADVYDALQVVKGPSFGTTFTMACPFMYLAHYDLVSSPDGRAFIRDQGIDPDLIRVSVGLEPAEAIIAAFETALGGVARISHQNRKNGR